MARMKIEATAARHARHGVPWRERLVAELPRYAPIAARVAGLANLRNRVPALRRLGERMAGLSAQRQLPAWRRDWFRDGSPRGDVLLFADTFNRWFEPENLRAAERVLLASGVEPASPGHICCGRTFLAAGMVDRARHEARRALAALAGPRPVIGLEPSCLLTLRDEFPALLPGPEADDLAARSFLLSEYLERFAPQLALAPVAGMAHVHGHCHQKAHGAFPDALASLRRVPGLDVRPIESSCCGMAGAFGYGAETQDVSRAMAEVSLLPAVRQAGVLDWVVADGTSCRHQIRDLAGRDAIHSVQLIDRALAPSKT